MSIPDYTLSAEDQRTVLILVKQIGQELTQKSFTKIYNKISSIQHVHISESNQSRTVWLRYENNYSPENNEWGDFQTYRKVLGLISIGKSDLGSKEELCEEHEKLLEKYNNSVYDSRCFIFCSDNDSPSDANENTKFLLENNATSPDCTHSPILDNVQNDLFRDSVEPVPKSQMVDDEEFSRSSDSDSSDSEVPKTNGNHELSDDDNKNFNSLPNVELTSKCENSSSDKLASDNFSEHKQNHSSPCKTLNLHQNGRSSPLVTDSNFSSDLANGSQKFIIPSTSYSRSTHCIVYSSVDNCDQLDQDVREFINSIFWVLESKRLDKSFEKKERIPLLFAPFEKNCIVGLDLDTKIIKRRCLGRMRKHIGDLALQAGIPFEAYSLYSSAAECLKSASDWLWFAAASEGMCASSLIISETSSPIKAILSRQDSPILHPKLKTTLSSKSNSLPLNMDPSDIKQMSKSVLSLTEICEKYEDAIFHYYKYNAACIIEVECSMKLSRIFIKHGKYLEAEKALQNVIFTSLNQTDTEKVRRFDAVAEIYQQMKFYRKASFFKRIAAMRCVSVSNPNPNWTKCYQLLLGSLKGYCLPFDAKDFPTDISYGWAGIQLQILLDLVGVSKQMNNQALAVRHMTFLLHTLMGHLSPSEQQDICTQLENLTAKCEGAPVPLSLENDLVLPPVNLINLPRVKTFKLQNLAPHLRPVKMVNNTLKAEDAQDSIFIFSPIPKEKCDTNSYKMNFKWVEGDVCEVALQVFNPLPFELKVTHMGLLADNIPFESFPACLSLPPQSGPYPVNLLGTPLGSGEMEILGHTTHVLGVKSICRLQDIPDIQKPSFVIEVIPCLPQVMVSTSLPKASMFSSLGDTSYVVASATTTIYSGERQTCTVTVKNVSKVPVEYIDLSLHSKLKADVQSKFFTWNKSDIESQLPVLPDCDISFTVYINAIGEFVKAATVKTVHDNIKDDGAPYSSNSNTPVKRKTAATESVSSKTVEAVLQMHYSGSSGKEAGYCRQCAISLTVEMLPSIVITKWDVLPAEIPSHCYLVLDIQNATASEMEVTYSKNKRMLIEAHDVCRVPVSVERCPLSVMSATFGEVWATYDMCGYVWENASNIPSQRKDALFAACRNHLVNLVDLQWTLSAIEVSGKASIAEITWSSDMLGFILMPPVQWDIQVNGKMLEPECEFNFPVGDLICISIKLINVSQVTLYNLHLCVKGYQDHQNGRQNYRLETKRAIIGRERLDIDKVLPDEEFSHECAFLFFHSGVYKVDILCSHNNPYSNSALLQPDSDPLFGPGENKINMCKPHYNDPCLIQKSSLSINLNVVEE